MTCIFGSAKPLTVNRCSFDLEQYHAMNPLASIEEAFKSSIQVDLFVFLDTIRNLGEGGKTRLRFFLRQDVSLLHDNSSKFSC